MKLNIGKSRALAISPWDTSVRIIDIPYHTEANILGFHITSKVQDSAHKSWTITTAQIRAPTQDAYCRDLSLDKRIKYVHDYLMTRVRYIAQIYPPLDECVRRLKTISWYVWGGEIFRVPLSTLQNRKGEGGWDLTHIIAKSCALFLYRLRQQGVRSGTLTAEWLRLWVLMAQNKNRPHRRRKPVPLEYLRRYAVDVAYVTQQGSTEWQSTNNRRLYDTMHDMCRAATESKEMRITN